MKTAQLTFSLGRGRRPRLNRMWNFAGPRHFHVLVDVASCYLNLSNVPHDILFKKIKKIPINPYITNWQMHILTNRSQRVEIDDVTTKFLNINRGVPQGTVRGPIMFTVLVNDIKAVNT